MKQRTYKIQICSMNGTAFRIITDRLTDIECGLLVIIITNKQWGNQIIDGIFQGTMHGAYLLKAENGAALVINPEVVVGWTIPRLFTEDITNKEMQKDPGSFCRPGGKFDKPIEV